jgi:hypothetical protein
MSENLPSHGIHLVQNSTDHVGMANVVQQDGAFGKFTMFVLGLGMQI